ncbi:MAG TPA: TetR/AcrR family transcriptional regulator [Acidimicrobiales bacterium]|nr:TetR/AcrR family transcriptional regulator [Acidimicrobiales bacterium]
MTSPAAPTAGRRPRLPRGAGRQLRDEILTATERMLLETGSTQAVSIRAVADAVGVTPPSIYRHFADKTELIFEVCARHFTALEEHIARACEGIGDPVERLAALGKAYIEFGVANPEPYRVMFMTRPDVAPEQYKGEMLASSNSFAVLMRCVQDCIDAGRFRPEYRDAFALSLGFWARVHGLTSLRVSKPDMAWPDDPRFIDDYTDMCLWGVVRGDG